MKKQEKTTIGIKDKSENKKCGAITCIHNVCGQCQINNCEFFENVLIQEH